MFSYLYTSAYNLHVRAFCQAIEVVRINKCNNRFCSLVSEGEQKSKLHKEKLKTHATVTFVPRHPRTVRKRAENLDRQTERCGASHERHRPWSDATATRVSALARHPTAHHIQSVLSAGVQVFTRPCTAVSCRAIRTGRRRHGAPQSALCPALDVGK